MNIFLYIIIFIIGSLFGSFYTLAVHRIPKKQDITHTHSYCPNCNNKLGFLDLIPIFSYIFLRGKCRYCKQKIRPRYLILEIASGIIFIAIAYAINLKIETLSLVKIVECGFLALYITFLMLTIGIDKENRKIEKYVSIYGIVISIAYMIYLCIVEPSNIYRYGIYLTLYIIILILDTITLRKYAKNSYETGILLMIITMAIFTGEYVTISTIIYTLLIISLRTLLKKFKERKSRRKKADKEVIKNVNFGFCMGIINIIILTIVLYSCYYII